MKGGRSRGNVQPKLRATRLRVARLHSYMDANVLRPPRRFCCPNFRECRISVRSGDHFREGVMSHIGRHYDLLLDDRPLRMVVVGQEAGWPKVPGRLQGRKITLEERYQTVHDRAGLERRYYAEGGHLGRNPHMRGTTSALRVIFGKGIGTEHDDEFVRPVRGRPFHIFDGFALVNRLLCSASPEGSSEGRSTRTMQRNCLEHFRATMDILEPTLVILQGIGVARWSREVFVPTRRYSDHLAEADNDGRRVLVCAFSHPSAREPYRWGADLDAPYLRHVVVPTLRRALRRL
jgi:hypothetical protein